MYKQIIINILLETIDDLQIYTYDLQRFDMHNISSSNKDGEWPFTSVISKHFTS